MWISAHALRSPDNVPSGYIARNIPYKYYPKYGSIAVATNATDKSANYQATIINNTIAITNIGWTQNAKANCSYDFNIWYTII